MASSIDSSSSERPPGTRPRILPRRPLGAEPTASSSAPRAGAAASVARSGRSGRRSHPADVDEHLRERRGSRASRLPSGAHGEPFAPREPAGGRRVIAPHPHPHPEAGTRTGRLAPTSPAKVGLEGALVAVDRVVGAAQQLRRRPADQGRPAVRPSSSSERPPIQAGPPLPALELGSRWTSSSTTPTHPPSSQGMPSPPRPPAVERCRRGLSTDARRPHVAYRRVGGGQTLPLDRREAATCGLSTGGRRPDVAFRRVGGGQTWPPDGSVGGVEGDVDDG